MEETGIPGLLTTVAGYAENLETRRETVLDQPRVDGLPLAHLYPVLIPATLNMVDGKASLRSAAITGPAIVVKDFMLQFERGHRNIVPRERLECLETRHSQPALCYNLGAYALKGISENEWKVRKENKENK